MKKLALILLCGVASMALSAEEYTIQTISALKESSITPAFEQKIKKTGIPYIKKTEGDRHVVLLGKYNKTAETKHDVKKVRTMVAHDAFVRPMDRATVATAGKPEVHVEAVSHTAQTTPVVAPATAPIAVATTPTVASVAATVEKKEECAPHLTAAPSETVVIYDRNAMRKNDISEAIEFYKTSPYHSFRPVALQR